jgi:hypothetical protein
LVCKRPAPAREQLRVTGKAMKGAADFPLAKVIAGNYDADQSSFRE